MAAALLSPAAMLPSKVFSMLSEAPVAAYVDSLELGHNSEQIKDKLAHTLGLLHNAQVSDVGHNPGLQRLLPALSRNADQAEDLLDELHYFQIHDRLHGTSYATTKSSFLRHGRNALRHTASSCWTTCFSCSSAQDDIGSASGNDDDHGDELHFDPVTMSRKVKSVLQAMQTQCDSVSDLLGSIPRNSMAVTAIRRPESVSTIIQDTLYGRSDTFEETVSRIINCNQIVSVLPIVGPGGIGKTTFTQHLYNDARLYSDNDARLYSDTRVENHFDVRVWVCVSTEFDVLKITRQILGSIPASKEDGSNSVANETTNLDQVQKSTANRLKSKRFLIVLDDIWKCSSEDQWKTLLAPFTKGQTKGSIVLVTTRFPKVAALVKTVDPLELRGLESNDFFTFFEACIFGDHKPEHYEYELVGIAGEIAKKLKGSPLAAKTVGKLLQKNLSQEHWNGVLDSHERLNQTNEDDIMPSLKIGYDYLPFDLKKCFSYFGLYPEDHEFDNSEMSHIFVAIGITDSTQQVDRNYLEELVENGFLMKQVNYFSGRECYVLHDLMHELCRSVSAQECLNISGLDFRANNIPQSVRHLSITIQEKYDTKFEEEMYKLRRRIDIASLRTLMIFGSYEERIAKILKDCFKEINSLRVLFMEVNSLDYFPRRFSKLIHLQYLKIWSTEKVTMSLPSTLSRFYHLKFLDLKRWNGSTDLPEDFCQLGNLHDFRAKSELHSKIRNVGKIKHLQKLKEFHVKKEIIGFELAELGALEALEGKLIIHGLKHVAAKEEAAAAKLVLKTKLKELKLLWDRDQPTIDVDILDALKPHSNLRVLTIVNHGGATGPSWLCLDIWLTSLDTLTLEGISWSTLPPFGKLPNLKVLTFRRISGMRQFQCGGTPGKCFTRLKEIGFHEMPELAEWVVEPNCHSFPSLEIIECVDCPNLCGMPFSACTNLCELKVSGCPKMSLPSMPHTSTLKIFVVEGANLERLSYDGKKLVVREYSCSLAFHNLDRVEDMFLVRVSHISVLEVMSHLGSLWKLIVEDCKDLVLVPVENGEGIQEDNSSLQSLYIVDCGKLFSRWPLGEAGGGVPTIYPFPASVRLLEVYEEESLTSMAVLSNLTSLTRLQLFDCSNLTVDGFNPLTLVNLKSLYVVDCNTLAADLLSEVARTKLLPADYISRLEELAVDDISRLLVSPICNLLAPALHTLKFHFDDKAESFTDEQEEALQLLTSLQNLQFSWCSCLQSLPQGLDRLSSLKELCVCRCPEIRSMPKEGFPVSLRKLQIVNISGLSAEMVQQIEESKRTNPDLTFIDY